MERCAWAWRARRTTRAPSSWRAPVAPTCSSGTPCVHTRTRALCIDKNSYKHKEHSASVRARATGESVQEDLLGDVEVVERDELRELVDRVHVRELARELGAARTHEQT